MAITVIVIDDTPLNLADLAHSCAVSQEWIVEHGKTHHLTTRRPRRRDPGSGEIVFAGKQAHHTSPW